MTIPIQVAQELASGVDAIQVEEGKKGTLTPRRFMYYLKGGKNQSSNPGCQWFSVVDSMENHSELWLSRRSRRRGIFGTSAPYGRMG